MKNETQDRRAWRVAERGTPQWDAAWLGLTAQGWGLDDKCGCCGEVWQYMGTTIPAGPGCPVAEFRHRHHPRTGARVNVRVEVTPALIERATDEAARREGERLAFALAAAQGWVR